MIAMLIFGLVWLAVVGGLAWLYVLPSLIAFRRRHPHRWIILIVDLMFGASVIGWLWALFWALRAPRFPAVSAGTASALDVLTDDVRALVLAKPAAAPPSPGPVSAGTPPAHESNVSPGCTRRATSLRLSSPRSKPRCFRRFEPKRSGSRRVRPDRPG